MTHIEIKPFAPGWAKAAIPNAWLFDKASCDWNSSDQSKWFGRTAFQGGVMTQYIMHNMGDPVDVIAPTLEARDTKVNMKDTGDEGVVSLQPELPWGNKQWLEQTPFDKDGVTTQSRAQRWGRPKWSDNVYSTPFTLNLRINGHYYEVPDLWMQVDTKGGYAVNSNWGTYGVYQPNKAGDSMEVYAYEAGNVEKPVVLKFLAAQVKTSVVTRVTVERPIVRDATVVDAFVDEFNWLLAKWRSDIAAHSAYTYNYMSWPWSGFLGWMGMTSDMVKEMIDDPDGRNHWDTFDDPILVMQYGAVGGVCRDLYITNLSSYDMEPEYTQQFTVVNEMDQQQNVRTSDYAHAIMESTATTTTQASSVNTKVNSTFKWEEATATSSILPISANYKFSVAIMVEAGYSYTWTASETKTKTDTKTYTMGGQIVTLPPQTAATVEVAMMRVNASGSLGYAMQITDTPKVYVGPVNTPLYETKIDLVKAAKVLGMKSVVDGHYAKDAKKHFPGAFVKPVAAFSAVRGAAGSVAVHKATYVPPKNEVSAPIDPGLVGP